MCTFSEVEARSCLLSHRVTTAEMMTRAPCFAETPHKRSLASATLQYQPSDQQVSWDLYPGPRLMNESFPLISLSKHTVSKGWIEEDIKHRQQCEGRRKYRHSAVMNIWKPSSGRNVLRKGEMYLCWLSKIFFLGLIQICRRCFKENDTP